MDGGVVTEDVVWRRRVVRLQARAKGEATVGSVGPECTERGSDEKGTRVFGWVSVCAGRLSPAEKGRWFQAYQDAEVCEDACA